MKNKAEFNNKLIIEITKNYSRLKNIKTVKPVINIINKINNNYYNYNIKVEAIYNNIIRVYIDGLYFNDYKYR